MGEHLLAADIREQQKHLDALRDDPPSDFSVEVRQLDVGDYQILRDETDPVLCIEHKAPADYLASLRDKRLFAQAHEMRKSGFAASLVVVDGDYRDVLYNAKHQVFGRKRGQGFHPNAIMAATCSLILRYGTPVFFCGSGALVWTVKSLAEKAVKNEPVIYQPLRDNVKKQDMAASILAVLPNVGPKTAGALLEHFGSPLEAFSRLDEWGEVDGVGPVTVEKAREVLE